MLNITPNLAVMTKSRKSARSLRSVSPVSPTQADLDAALDVLNNSLDSRLFNEMTGSRFEVGNDDATVRMSEPSPTLFADENLDKDTSVLIKCQTLIDDLQTELDAQRKRNDELESELKLTRTELDTLRTSSTSKHVSERLESEVKSLKHELLEAQQVAKKKDIELENMTRHCERRLDEMKRQLKQNSTHSTLDTRQTVATVDQEELKQLRYNQKLTEKKLSSHDEEMRSVVDCYERQLRALREQLEQSQGFFRSYYAAKAKTAESTSAQRSNPFRDY